MAWHPVPGGPRQPPTLVTVSPTDGEPGFVGWVFHRTRRVDGWWGWIVPHNEPDNGRWVHQDRITVKHLDRDEVRGFGGVPAGPDGEPETYG